MIKRLLQILFRPWSKGLPHSQSQARRHCHQKRKRSRDRTYQSVPREDAVKALNKTYQQPAVIPDWAIKASAPSLFSRSLLFGNSKFGRKLKIQLAKAHRAKQKSLNRRTSRRLPSVELPSQPDGEYDVNDATANYSDHPDLIKSLTDAAYVCDCQGRYNETERLYQDVLKLSIQRFGEGHAELIVPLADLANFFCERRRYLEAEPLLLQLIELRSRIATCFSSALHFNDV